MPLKLPPQADAVVISVNPKAGRSSPMRRAEKLREALQQLGLTVDLLTDLDQVTSRTNALQSEGRLRALIGVGGDGTAAELVNRTAPGTPVTLLPAGTANLLAKQLGYPSSPTKMAKMVAEGCLAQFDAGRVNGRLFLAMFSAGIDADIVRQVHAHREENYRKKTRRGAHISYLSYIGPIFESLKTYSYPKIDVECLDTLTKKHCRWAFVFNFPRYGWGVSFTPDCPANDGLLNACLFHRGWMIPSLWNVLWAQFGELHRFLPGTSLKKGRSFRFSSTDKVPYQLDGDFAGYFPAQVDVVSGRFTSIVPRKMAEKLEKMEKRKDAGSGPHAE